MAQVLRPNCTGIVRSGPRTGLPCSVYSGDGPFVDYCFHHVPEGLTLEDGEQCTICLEEKKISWISSCACKLFYCKECLVKYQNTVRGVTDCPTCRMPMNDTSILANREHRSVSRRITERTRPSEVVLDFNFTLHDGVACSVTDLPQEDQEEFLRRNYILPLQQFPGTKYNDLNVIAPALDKLREKRIKKLMKKVGTDPFVIVKEYEKYITEENYEDYKAVNNMSGEEYKAAEDLLPTKMFPFNIEHIYWVASDGISYFCFYRDDKRHGFSDTKKRENCFVARRNGNKWKFVLYLDQSVAEFLTDLKKEMSYFYNLYRVDAREG